MKFLLYLIILILLTVSSIADCTEPKNFITTSTEFCKDNYTRYKEITIVKNNLIIDCQNSVLIGDKTTLAFLIESLNNITIKNCNINNFLNGISIKKSNNINLNNNILTNNTLAVNAFNVNYLTLNNIYKNNQENEHFDSDCKTDDFCNFACTNDEDCIIKIKQETNQTTKEIKQEQKINLADKIFDLTTNEDKLLSKTVKIKKTKKLTNDSTTYQVNLNPLKNIKSLIIYIYLSSELKDNLDLVEFSHAFEYIQEESLVKVELNDLKKNQPELFSYKVNKVIYSNPQSIIVLEPTFNFTRFFLLIIIAIFLTGFLFDFWKHVYNR
jgi:hypothetical protein